MTIPSAALLSIDRSYSLELIAVAGASDEYYGGCIITVVTKS